MKNVGGNKVAAFIQPRANSMPTGLALERRPTSADTDSIRFERTSYFQASTSAGGYGHPWGKKACFIAAVGSWGHLPLGQLFQQAARSGGEVWLSTRD